MENDKRFSFGENWNSYIQRELNTKRVEEAVESLKGMLKLSDFRNKTFLDIGCGSGLFSLAAYKLGASFVHSFDYDSISVECCKYLWQKEGSPKNWKIEQGSILDGKYISSLKKADIVYSWGVLHHTGKMWDALSNAASLVKRGGLLFIAIYNKREGNVLSSHFWLKVKLLYVLGSRIRRSMLLLTIAILQIVILLARFKNPIRYVQGYDKQRGMSFWRDLVDWVGGYPYEFATAEEVFTFCHHDLDLQLESVKLRRDIGCNEFVFKKP